MPRFMAQPPLIPAEPFRSAHISVKYFSGFYNCRNLDAELIDFIKRYEKLVG
jgi:hypothetical protein